MATFRVEGKYKPTPNSKKRTVVIYLEHPHASGIGVEEHAVNTIFPESRHRGKNYTETLTEKDFELISTIQIKGTKDQIAAFKAEELSKTKNRVKYVGV